MKCHNCDDVIFETIVLGKGLSGKNSDSPVKREYHENESFYRCPHCGAKNFLKETEDDKGVSREKIYRYSIDG